MKFKFWNISKSFLMVGNTQESKEAAEIKRYVGIGTSKVLAVNPTKTELEKIYGRDIQNDPEYSIERDDQKGFCVDIIVETVPEMCNGIDIISHARFNLFPELAYNKDKTKVRVVDNYGNSAWANVEDAKAGKVILSSKGEPMKIDTKYRLAFSGEVDLLDFLRKFLYNQDTFEMPNGTWKKMADADDRIIGFENPKALLGGNIKEVKELIALQPNNRIKLLYGVKASENAETGRINYRQNVCTAYDLMLRNNATASGINNLEKNLNSAKASGRYSKIDYQVCELKEWDVKPTNLEKPASDTDNMPFDTPSAGSESGMPWD